VIGAIVETKELLETVFFASVSGIGMTLIFSLAIYGSTRYADLSRDQRPVAATAAAALAIFAFLASLALVVIGIVVMSSK